MTKFLRTIPLLFSGFIHISPDLPQIVDSQIPQKSIILTKTKSEEIKPLSDISSQTEISPSTVKQTQPITTVIEPIQTPIVNPVPRWTLTAGHAIGQELKNWGSQSGWNVIWNLPRDVIVPSTTEFVGEFKAAATNVIETLAANGVLIHAKFYDGNKTMVINGPGVVPQN